MTFAGQSATDFVDADGHTVFGERVGDHKQKNY
jgi:hypothetical protein